MGCVKSKESDKGDSNIEKRQPPKTEQKKKDKNQSEKQSIPENANLADDLKNPPAQPLLEAPAQIAHQSDPESPQDSPKLKKEESEKKSEKKIRKGKLDSPM